MGGHNVIMIVVVAAIMEQANAKENLSQGVRVWTRVRVAIWLWVQV